VERKLLLATVAAFLITFIVRYISFKTGSRYLRYLHYFMLSCLSLSVVIGLVLTALIFSEVNSNVTSIDDTDYAVILGAGLIGDQVSFRLKLRLDAAIDVLNDTETLIIVSGGQGPHEKISEAEAMSRYLVKSGIESERIILEDQSTSTQENIRLSNEIINMNNANVLLITSDYHMYRAKMLGRRIGWEVSGQSAVNQVSARLRRMFREVFALMKDIIVKEF